MAAVVSKRSTAPTDSGAGEPLPVRKRLKLSDLPVASAKRADIETLVQKMKKKGFFDALRKQSYQKFENSVCHTHTALALSLSQWCKDALDIDSYICVADHDAPCHRNSKPPSCLPSSPSSTARLTTTQACSQKIGASPPR
jgi:hypothetical protein